MSLREERKAANLTQQQLAQLVGCSLSYIAMLERGYVPKHESAVMSRLRRVLLTNGEGPPAKEPSAKTVVQAPHDKPKPPT